MEQNVPQTWTATWLLFTVLATGGALGAQRYYTPGAISEARVIDDAARQLMGPPARFAQRAGLAPISVGQRSETGRATLSRREAVVLLMLMQGVRPTLAR
ncbi:MAG TPA: hypothetical protein VE997_07840 [Candidatus Limnocylindria bacterium]|jgi:hypothetical protein|nr:hypothetical protein [Candidatus Limnocylindria bacterium]